MNRYLGFHYHRYGDLFINLAACRILKRLDPDSHLTFAINGDYRNAAPLFLDQLDIDNVHITHNPVGGFDEEDIKWVNTQRFQHVFNPLADHDHRNPWFRTGRNQPLECAFIHGLPIEGDTGKLSLNRWFEPTKGLDKYVALQAFAGSYDPANQKQLSPIRAQQIVDLIVAKGYKVLQLGLSSEHKLDNTVRVKSDYFQMVKNMLGCQVLVTTDSGTSWAASCYDHPTLGMYSNSYYSKKYVGAIQPLNPNAIYLDAANVNDLSLESISVALDQLLS